MTEPADIMVIAAHPDDAEFGSAGAVAKWIGEGKRVVYVVCTSGDKGSSDPDMIPEQLAEIREREQTEAAAVLGVSEVLFLRYLDQTLEDTPHFRKVIVRHIRTYRPEMVVTSDPYRRYVWHRDHRIVGQVTLDAIFPYARDVMAYPDLIEEGFMPHKVQKVLLWGTEDVNLHIDIADTFDLKVAALRCHKSQVDQFKVSDLRKWLWERYSKLAEGTDFEVVEAFHQVEITM